MPLTVVASFKMARNKAPKDEWELDEIKEAIAELQKEALTGSERSAVLVGAAMVDECLRRLLFKNMPDRTAAEELLADDGRAPLGTFSARIVAARALGIINAKERRCLETIRKIRNQYAHRFTHEIDHKSIADMLVPLRETVDDLCGHEEQKLDGDLGAQAVFAGCALGTLQCLLIKF